MLLIPCELKAAQNRKRADHAKPRSEYRAQCAASAENITDALKGEEQMLVGGLGIPEIIIILIVLLTVVGVPVAIIALVLFFIKRTKNSNADMKKCPFCAYSIPVEAKVCRYCGRELAQ